MIVAPARIRVAEQLVSRCNLDELRCFLRVYRVAVLVRVELQRECAVRLCNLGLRAVRLNSKEGIQVVRVYLNWSGGAGACSS
jgi:hypothetical protein